MKAKQDAIEIYNRFRNNEPVLEANYKSKKRAIIALDRNIEMLTNLVNKMDDFSNESRQVIWQIIDNEQQTKEQLEILK